MDENDAKQRAKRALDRFYERQTPKPRASSKASKAPPKEPKEDWEQTQLVKIMNAAGLHFTHIPNEGKRTKWGGRRLFTSLGCRKAFPDFLIFNRPNNEVAGVAIELKRVSLSSPRWGSKEQHAELELLSSHGWLSYVCRGHLAALWVLNSLGLVSYITPPESEALARRYPAP